MMTSLINYYIQHIVSHNKIKVILRNRFKNQMLSTGFIKAHFLLNNSFNNIKVSQQGVW